MKRPKIKDEVSIKGIQNICEEYLDACANGYVDDDLEHFIFETVMEALYGDDVWIYVNYNLE